MSDQAIKPNLSGEQAAILVEKLYGLVVSKIEELTAYDDRNFHILASASSNPYISEPLPTGYVLKIINSTDSENISLAEGQTRLLLWLQSRKFPAPIPVKNLIGGYFSQEHNCSENPLNLHVVRLLEYQTGQTFKSVPGEHRLYQQVGVWLANLNNALKAFHHPVFDQHSTMWNLKSVPVVKNYISLISDISRRALVEEVVNGFINEIGPKINDMEKGMIHGDFNEQNILVNLSNNLQWNISGVLDFGDANFSCYLFDIGAALCYVMLEARRNNLDYLSSSGETLRGYMSVRPLSALECSLLKLTVCSRLCQSLVLGLYTQNLQPENAYVSETQTFGWAVLSDLWNSTDEAIKSAWGLS